MDKCIAWNEITKEKISWEELCKLDNDGILCLIDLILEQNPNVELFKSTGKTDIHGNEIYYDFHVVKFKYNSAFAIWVDRIGVFRYNEDELRGEIDISDQHDCICLWYDSSIMSDFEIIGNVKENPELIGEGK